MNPLVDDNGRPLALGPELARGGEGAVFTVPADPTVVIKVYHAPPSTQTTEKLTTMVRLGNAKLREVAAWPTRIVRHANTNRIAGFVMPRLTDFQPLQHLYNPVMRLRTFPRAGWAFQVAAATNLAAAFEEVHKTGCLVGDINQSNAFVNNTALVRLIDCDSFQVPRAGRPPFPCEVGTPHYTPPELQGWSLRGVLRTENHDRFGLAVLLYQLLYVGRHPYAGIYRGTGDPSFEQLIAEYRFAQGPQAHTWGMSPPPHTPTFADIPPEVGDLFRRAFERGGENNRRPTAREWHATLGQLSRSLATCGADAGHQFWNGQSRCVWCRLAAGGGPEYYFGVAGGGGTFAVDEAKLRQVLQRVAAVAMPPEVPVPRFPPVQCTPQPLPSDLVPLRQAVEFAKVERDRELARRREAASREIAAIAEREKAEADRKRNEYKKVFAELGREVADAEAAVRRERGGRGVWTAILMAGFAVGVLTLPLAFVKRSIGWVSGTVSLVCGIGLVAHTVAGRSTAARRELNAARRRRTRADDLLNDALRNVRTKADNARRESDRVTARVAEQASRPAEAAERHYRNRVEELAEARGAALRAAKVRLAALESDWSSTVQSVARRYAELSSRLTATITESRSLTAEYARDSQMLAANAEAQSRTRHMRLHLLADAEIALIGAGRLQVLASNGIATASDVDRERVLRIYGFGPVLAKNLTDWRDEILRRFRFDPATDVSPAERTTLVARYRARHQQLLTRLEESVSELERLATVRHVKLSELERSLRVANADYHQVEADRRLILELLASSRSVPLRS